MFVTRIEFKTLLSPSECVRRLKEGVRPWWLLFGKQAVIGSVRTNTFSVRTRIYYGNSFQTVLRGQLSESPEGGTDIRCNSGMRPWVLAFMAFWFGGVVLMGGTLFVDALTGSLSPQQSDSMGYIVPPIMLIFGIALVAFGRFLARNEEDQLREFIRLTLDAKEVPSLAMPG